MKSLFILSISVLLLGSSACDEKKPKQEIVTLNDTTVPDAPKPTQIGITTTSAQFLGLSEDGSSVSLFILDVINKGQNAPELNQGDTLKIETATLPAELLNSIQQLKKEQSAQFSFKSIKKMGQEFPVTQLISITN